MLDAPLPFLAAAVSNLSGSSRGVNTFQETEMVDHLIAVALSLPLGTTPEQVSELLWTRIGFEVPASVISVRDAEYSANAFVRVTEETLVAFLNRNFSDCILDGQREAVRFATKKIRKDGDEKLTRTGVRRL
jgi:hypothetical protein